MLICFFGPINTWILRILSYELMNFDMPIKVEEKALLWSRLYEKYFTWSFIFCLWTNWRHLVTCSKTEFRELYYCSHCALDKICEIYTFDRCPHGCSSQNHFWLVAMRKKRIGERLKYFWNMCPKSFSSAKKKRKHFSDGKSIGPLLARAALNQHARRYTTTEKLSFLLDRVCIPNTMIDSCQKHYNSYSLTVCSAK